MQPMRFPGPNHVSQQTQWRPHGTVFRPRWPEHRRTRPANNYSNNSQSTNEEYWCETCDRGFRTSQLLENHKQQHQKCNIDGCEFVAHPKVITKHIQMQHSTGLFKKISKLNNPEEIKKWREERKRRYPTKENIEKKDAEIKEKMDRGEKMGMKYNRDKNSYNREQSTKRKYSDNNHRRNVKNRYQANMLSTDVKKCKSSNEENKRPRLPQRDKPIQKMDDTRTLKPFAGILNLVDETENDNEIDELQHKFTIDDDEYVVDESNQKNTPVSAEPVVCEALSSLMCNYESSDNDSILEPKLKQNKPDTANKLHDLMNYKNEGECPEKNDDSGPEETKILKVPITEQNNDLTISNNKKQKHSNITNQIKVEKKCQKDNAHKRNNMMKFKSKLPSTLLEKLLQKEIRQERNIVLQCIRYIVKNKYFDNK